MCVGVGVGHFPIYTVNLITDRFCKEVIMSLSLSKDKFYVEEGGCKLDPLLQVCGRSLILR